MYNIFILIVHGYLIELLVLIIMSYDVIKTSNESSINLYNFIINFNTIITSSFNDYLNEDNIEDDFKNKLFVYMPVISFFTLWITSNPKDFMIVDENSRLQLIISFTPLFNCINHNNLFKTEKKDNNEDISYGYLKPFRNYLVLYKYIYLVGKKR